VHALQVQLFGSMEMRAGERVLLKPPTLKSQSLLAYLLVHRRRPHPRERLADMFWGERPQEKAHHSLATALWHIRRCLGDGFILSDQTSVHIDPQAPIWLDVEAFVAGAAAKDPARLQEVVALYRGDFLDGFYDDWVISDRYRLEALYTEALTRLMTACQAQGEHEAALASAPPPPVSPPIARAQSTTFADDPAGAATWPRLFRSLRFRRRAAACSRAGRAVGAGLDQQTMGVGGRSAAFFSSPPILRQHDQPAMQTMHLDSSIVHRVQVGAGDHRFHRAGCHCLPIF